MSFQQPEQTEKKIKSVAAESGHVEAILRACDVLRTWRYEGELLRLRDVLLRVPQLRKTTAHRVLRSLVAGGLIERVSAEQYRSLVRPLAHRRRRIGYAGQAQDSMFSSIVSASFVRAAAEHDVDLVIVNNRYSARTAVRNAESLVRDHVDLVIEFQTYENVAPVVANRFLEVGIPVIAIEIPHPGAIYFGANNYQAGLIGGRALGKWAKENWNGVVDHLLLLEEQIAGPLPKSRITGMLNGVREMLPQTESARVLLYDGKGSFEHSMNVVRKYIRTSTARRVLVMAGNDSSALGALRAFEESGRAQYCAVMGQNGIPEALEELRRKGSRLIGTVAYFPERYGDEVIPLALSMLGGKSLPPAVFVKHRLLVAANVDSVYPPVPPNGT